MHCTTVTTPTSRCRAGLAITDITPPVGMYHRMWGAAAHDRSTGVHRPLRASVLVLAPDADSRPSGHRESEDSGPGSDTDSPQVLVALDHCLLRPPEMAAFRQAFLMATGLADEQVTVVFSHTHSAGLLARDRAGLPGGEQIGPYLDQLPERMAAAFRDAVSRLQPVTLTYAQTDCRMGHHRDARDDERGICVCGFNPDIELALPVKTVRLTAADGSTRAVIVNYPCHPTTLAWQNSRISPDYVGALRETVEQFTGAPCLFLLAPCGDIGPRDGFTGDPAVADRNGRQVAFAALQALESMPPAGHDTHYAGPVVSGATLGTWEHRPHDETRRAGTARFEPARLTVPLGYRSGLPTLEQAGTRLIELETNERQAREAGRDDQARELRALVERQRREIERLRPLPPGTLPFPVRVWRLGDAVWIAVDGEPYFALQTELERRLPDLTLIILPLSDGALAGYLPSREAFKKPFYQVAISVLAPGCLEAVIEAIAAHLTGPCGTP